MENLKIRVNSEAESKEAKELFFELGGAWKTGSIEILHTDSNYLYLKNGAVMRGNCDDNFNENQNYKAVSLPELRALVSLHKNPINMDKVLSGVRSDALGLLEDKEWLNTKTYEYKKAVDMGDHGKWIEIPKGAEIYTRYDGGNEFYKSKNGIVYRFDECCWIETNWDSISEILKECERNNFNVLWKRHTQPEELPFVDDEPNQTTINAMNEADTLFADAVNHPSHYASGEIECIDAMEAMLTPEQFIGYLRGNAFKYQWRYENKGGITDLEKAQWYLNKLISRVG